MQPLFLLYECRLSEPFFRMARMLLIQQDLYIARAQGELVLEEELFKVLISIYRSSSVLFELTKRKRKQA